MDDVDQLMTLRKQGFFCSQILMSLGLELQGKTNPELVRAMNALAGGIGFTGELCGALTGGACLLGVYAGKGTPDEEDDPRLNVYAGRLGQVVQERIRPGLWWHSLRGNLGRGWTEHGRSLPHHGAGSFSSSQRAAG